MCPDVQFQVEGCFSVERMNLPDSDSQSVVDVEVAANAAKDWSALLMGLLSLDPDCRLTANKALKHPVFCRHGPGAAHGGCPDQTAAVYFNHDGCAISRSPPLQPDGPVPPACSNKSRVTAECIETAEGTQDKKSSLLEELQDLNLAQIQPSLQRPNHESHEAAKALKNVPLSPPLQNARRFYLSLSNSFNRRSSVAVPGTFRQSGGGQGRSRLSIMRRASLVAASIVASSGQGTVPRGGKLSWFGGRDAPAVDNLQTSSSRATIQAEEKSRANGSDEESGSNSSRWLKPSSNTSGAFSSSWLMLFLPPLPRWSSKSQEQTPLSRGSNAEDNSHHEAQTVGIAPKSVLRRLLMRWPSLDDS